ncbi:hypothetical protein BU25DRAFT_407896 [Macroventuria anomochaeta]|uniref:Uncharacterized protein n=1 Tax=Macroventuria anomochaeta TaxID=301207 RepID=A0ACB6S987_9PLEO|nr:uncharacterized protein BU25DRAFT_407896 [Macroventuria anomochaeta]KAF2630603.1 hypothetical protein BU25DRAFT_407896 [Macroventuria anomochaeta]
MLFGKKIPKAPEVLTPLQVKRRLELAEPAERGGNPYSPPGGGAEVIEYPNLNSRESNDSVWMCCCCGHETPLVHFKGAYPFKRLGCGSCNHVLCKHCETTETITPSQGDDFAPTQDEAELRQLQVCPSGHLSHRAVIPATDHRGKRLCWLPTTSVSHAEMCSCGELAKCNWQKYVIGETWTYLREPMKAAHELQEKQMKKKKMAMTASNHPQKRPEPVEKRADSLWERRGLRRMQALNPSQDAYNSIQNTPACSPTRMRTQPMPVPQIRRPDLTVNTSTSSLKRSGAQRGKPPSYTPRSATYQESPVTSRSPPSWRAETWATAEGHQRAHEVAEAALRSSLDARFDPDEDEDSYAQAGGNRIAQFVRPATAMTMHAPKPVRRAVTYDTLLQNAEDVPRNPLLVQTDMVLAAEVGTPTHIMIADEMAQEKTDEQATEQQLDECVLLEYLGPLGVTSSSTNE